MTKVKGKSRNIYSSGNGHNNLRQGRLVPSILALIMIMITAPATLNAQSEQPSRSDTLLILDGSGSMWGKIRDGHKIMIVREVIANSLRPLENKFNLGLMAYGHRRRGACNDIQTLTTPTPLNTNQFTRLVKRIKPLGKTPITNALATAVPLLAKNGGNIILLTDGPENCRRNPCQLITPEFARQNKITVHVVAFAMTEREAKTLRCLATNTGGKFLMAEDRDQLVTSLKTAFAASLNGLKAPGAKKPLAPIKERIRPELNLTAHLGPGTKNLRKDITWELIKLTKDQQPDEDLPPWKSSEPDPTFDLEAGNYRIRAEYKNYQITKDLTLKKGEERGEKIIFNLAELELPKGWDSPSARSGFGKMLLEPKTREKTDVSPQMIKINGKRQIMLVPTGAYKLTGLNNGKLQNWFIHTEPGKVTPLPIWKNTGRLQIAIKEAGTGKPLVAPLIRVLAYDPVKKQTTSEIARSTALNPQFDLTEGEYLIELREGFSKKAVVTKITSGYTSLLNLELERTSLKLDISGEDKNERWSATFYQLMDKKLNYVGTAGNLKDPIILPPATYRIALHHGGTTTTLKKAIKLTGSKNRTIKIKSQATPVQFVVSNRDDPLSRHQIFWQLYENSGTLIWQSTSAEPSIRLPQGRYLIRAEIGKDVFSRKIRVRGKKKTVFDLAKSQQN